MGRRVKFGFPGWGLRQKIKKETVERGEDAMGYVIHENMALRAGRLELRAAQMEHDRL